MIKAIETVYHGYRFRSRLEARWAVFFDSLGVPYEYEKEGFDLDGLRYLPDFWLPEQGCWVEIKGESPSAEECEKCERLARASYQPVFLFHGDVGPLNMQDIYDADGDVVDSRISGSALVWTYSDDYGYPEWGDSCREWGECRTCGKVGIGHLGFACCHNGWSPHPSPRLERAYTAARSARFEFGVRG